MSRYLFSLSCMCMARIDYVTTNANDFITRTEVTKKHISYLADIGL